MNQIVHGVNFVQLEVSGFSVVQVQDALEDVLNTDVAASAYLDGLLVTNKDTTSIQAGQRLEFIRERGIKRQDWWSQREVMEFVGLTEKDWEQCLTSGLKIVQANGDLIVAKAEVIALNARWKGRMDWPIRVDVAKNEVTLHGRTFVLDRIYILILEVLADAKGTKMSQSDMRKRHAELELEARLDKRIKALKRSYSEIRRHIRSDNKGYWLAFE